MPKTESFGLECSKNRNDVSEVSRLILGFRSTYRGWGAVAAGSPDLRALLELATTQRGLRLRRDNH
jgi:hypothetical protein